MCMYTYIVYVMLYHIFISHLFIIYTRVNVYLFYFFVFNNKLSLLNVEFIIMISIIYLPYSYKK